jgi:hypothetical protein
MSFYILVAFASVGFAEKTKAKGMLGIDILKFVLNKHIWFVYACVLCQSAFLISSYYYLFSQSDQDMIRNPFLRDNPEK